MVWPVIRPGSRPIVVSDWKVVLFARRDVEPATSTPPHPGMQRPWCRDRNHWRRAKGLPSNPALRFGQGACPAGMIQRSPCPRPATGLRHWPWPEPMPSMTNRTRAQDAVDPITMEICAKRSSRATRQLIEEKGPLGFTMAEAARAASVSPAAPYRHFKGREDLLEAVALRGFEMFAERLEAATRDGEKAPLTAFSAAGTAYLDFARQFPGLLYGDVRIGRVDCGRPPT